MNKWKMLGALTLAVGLVVAGTASGGVTLGTDAVGTAIWTTAQDTCGDYSVKLDYTSGNTVYVEFIPDTVITMADMAASAAEWSFWYKHITLTSGGPNIEMRFTMPVGYDPASTTGHADVNVQVMPSVTPDTWLQEDVDASTESYTYFNDPTDGTAGVVATPGSGDGFEHNNTIGQTLARINATTAMIDGGDTANVWELTRVRVEIGWGGTARICYIDDIIIDGETTVVEPGTPFKLVWTDQPTTKQAGVDLTAGKVSVQAADPDSGLIDTTGGISVTVKAYRADNGLLSDGLWNDGTVYNTVGIDNMTTNGVANIVGGDFDFSKVGTYKFRASSSGLTSGNSDNVAITYNQTLADMVATLTSPATMEVNTTDSVSALVRDSYGNIVTGGVTVNFNRFAGGSWTVTPASSATGYIAAEYTSGTSVLTGDSLEAYTAGGVRDTNYIALTPGALATIGATPPDYGVTTAAERVVCDSLSGPFDVELQDAWGNHIDAEDVAGKQITVGTVHGPLHGTCNTPVPYGAVGSKVWRFNYIGGDSVAAVEDTIPIGIAGSPGLCDIEVYALTIGGPIHTFTMEVNKDSVTVCSDSLNIITCDIEAKDIHGNLTEGRKIAFGITGSDGGAIGAPGDTCTTTDVGVVTGHTAYGAGSKAQLIYLTATATDGGLTADTTIYLIAEKGAGNIDSIKIAGADTISAGQEETLTFTYFDEFGNVMNIHDAATDTSFTNITTVGALDLSAVAACTTNTDTLMEWVEGVVFEIPYTGEPTLTETAVDTIVAISGAVVDTFLMSVFPVGEAAYFTVEASAETLTVNIPVTLTITAFDADSNIIYTYGEDTIATEITLTHTGTADSLMWTGDSVVDNRNGTGTIYDTIFGDGQAIVYLTNRKHETLTASVAETGKLAAGTSDTITWIPDSLYYFGIVAQTDPIYTGVPFAFTVTPYDTFANITSLGLPRWVEFGTNETGVNVPAGPLQFSATTAYSATASNASTSLILTVGTTAGTGIYGISDTITVIGLYTLSGTVGLSNNPGDLSGTKVTVSGGFFDSTDAIGHYAIPGLFAGTYNIIVTHEGYNMIITSGVVISANTVRNFMLEFITGIEEIPTVSFLSQNRPNPFAGGTTIEYGITKAGKVEIVVYNAVGQKVRTLVNSEEKAGYHKVNWDGTNDSGAKVGGGIYFYKITAGEFTSLKKLILLR